MAKINVGISFPHEGDDDDPLLFIPRDAYIGYTIEATSNEEAVKIVQEKWKHLGKRQFAELKFEVKS